MRCNRATSSMPGSTASANWKCASVSDLEPDVRSRELKKGDNNMSSPLKVALVTGAGSGIGRAVALALMADGFTLVLAGRRAEPLQALVELALSEGHEALAVPTDVRDPISVDALFATITEVYGRLDVVFNNAGVNAPAVPLDELTFEQWRNVIDTNLNGVFLCARGAFALMRRQQPQGG